MLSNLQVKTGRLDNMLSNIPVKTGRFDNTFRNFIISNLIGQFNLGMPELRIYPSYLSLSKTTISNSQHYTHLHLSCQKCTLWCICHDLSKSRPSVYSFTQLALHFVILYRYDPLKHHWAMQYESKHSYFKQLSSSLGNFINICHTLSARHEQFNAIFILIILCFSEVLIQAQVNKSVNIKDIKLTKFR